MEVVFLVILNAFPCQGFYLQLDIAGSSIRQQFRCKLHDALLFDW
jgi:hypothetical protein